MCSSISNSSALISLRLTSPHLWRYQNVDTFPHIRVLNCGFSEFFSPPEKIQALSHTFCANWFSNCGSSDVFAEQDKLSFILLVLTPPPEISWDSFICYPRVNKCYFFSMDFQTHLSSFGFPVHTLYIQRLEINLFRKLKCMPFQYSYCQAVSNERYCLECIDGF